MHERTERAIARMTFVFCCAIPTFAVLLIIVVTWTPWWHRRSLASIEADLSRDVGLVVKVEDFRRAAPSTLTLQGIDLLDPETQRQVARIRQAQWADHGDSISILLQQPELQSTQLAQVWKLLHDRFLCRPEQTTRSVRLAVNDLTIHSTVGPLPMTRVDAWIRPRRQTNAIEVTAQCFPANGYNSAMLKSPVGITVVRDREGEAPSTSWTLRTTDPLPCSALAEYLPPLGQLGDDAQFVGTLRWTLSRDGWSIDLGGSDFLDLSLSSWFENLSHKLTASSARLHLDRCRIVREENTTQVVDIAGALRARDGQIGPSLLRSARRHLGFAVAQFDKAVGYDRLAIGFNLNGPLLRLDGICRTEIGYEGLHSGVVICADGHSLAESNGDWLQATQLQAALAPEHSVMVPVSQQTSSLMQILMPPSRPTPTSGQSAARVTSTRPLSGEPSISQPK